MRLKWFTSLCFPYKCPNEIGNVGNFDNEVLKSLFLEAMNLWMKIAKYRMNGGMLNAC